MEELVLIGKLNFKNKEELDEKLAPVYKFFKEENIEHKEKFIEEWEGYAKTRHYVSSVGIYVKRKDEKKVQKYIEKLGNVEIQIENHIELKNPEEDPELDREIIKRKKFQKIIVYGTFLFMLVMFILVIIANNMEA